MDRNARYLVTAALIAIVGVLAFTIYQNRKQPEGVQISIGKEGIAIKNK